MASQEEQVQQPEPVTTEAEDAAKFAEAWDDLNAKESGQPDQASGRHDDTAGEGSEGAGDKAGQGEAQAGQPAAGTSPEADAGSSASRESSDDVWASADPKLREAHESALRAERERAGKAENLARSNGGRLAQALQRLNALEGKLAKATGSDGGETTNEELEAAKRDYPELVNPLIGQIDELKGVVAELTTAARDDAQAAVTSALGDEFKALTSLHPDVQQIVADPAYGEWVKGQPPAIQRIVAENSKAVVSAADCAMVFDRYKAERQAETPEQKAAREAAARRSSQLDAGRSATGGTQPGIRSDAGGNGSFEDEWDRLDRQDRQRAANRR